LQIDYLGDTTIKKSRDGGTREVEFDRRPSAAACPF